MLQFKIVFPVLLVAAVAAVSAQIPVRQQQAAPIPMPVRQSPPPAMPPLPSYHGHMAIGPVVFLSLPNSTEQKGYRPGDKVGPFKLLRFDSETITLDWNGTRIDRKLVDLSPKQSAGEQVQPAAPSPAAKPPSDTKPAPGVEIGDGIRACLAKDKSPDGTIADGYKKVITQRLMGKSCYWEKVK